MNTVVLFRLLGTLTVTALVLAAVLAAALSVRPGRDRLRGWVGGEANPLVGFAWCVSLVATAGSLYLSEGIGFIPCELCWYQRIAMFPLVLVLGVGALRSDVDAWRFALPLSLVGLLISIYHVALQFNPTIDVVSCDATNPCSTRYLFIFGFISIPTMAGAAFLLISLLLLAVRFGSLEGDEAVAGEGIA